MAEILTRRGLLGGLGALFMCAPAIVRASSLMPVKALAPGLIYPDGIFRGPYWADVNDVTRKAFLPRLHVQLYEESPFEARDG